MISTEILLRFNEVIMELKRSGINKKEVAEKLGLVPSNLTEKMQGVKRYPGLEDIEKLATEYGYSPNWIILGVGERKLGETVEIYKQMKELNQRLLRLEKTGNKREMQGEKPPIHRKPH